MGYEHQKNDLGAFLVTEHWVKTQLLQQKNFYRRDGKKIVVYPPKRFYPRQEIESVVYNETILRRNAAREFEIFLKTPSELKDNSDDDEFSFKQKIKSLGETKDIVSKTDTPWTEVSVRKSATSSTSNDNSWNDSAGSDCSRAGGSDVDRVGGSDGGGEGISDGRIDVGSDAKILEKRQSVDCGTRRSKRNKGTVEKYASLLCKSVDEEVTSATFRYSEKEFIEAHQDFCAVCGRDGFDYDLYLCHTCDLVWHKNCNDDDMSDERWQCSVCIEAGLSPDSVLVIPKRY